MNPYVPQDRTQVEAFSLRPECRVADSEPVGTVFFLHGLGGDPLATWSYDGTRQNFWPAQLAEQFVDLDFYTLGYPSQPFELTGTLGILGHVFPLVSGNIVGSSKRLYELGEELLEFLTERLEQYKPPYMFVCHSLGGLVLKTAIESLDRQVRECRIPTRHEKYSNLEKSIRQIVFLATPHQSTSLAALLPRVIELFRDYLPVDTTPIMGDLADFKVLSRLDETFCLWADKRIKDSALEVANYVETKPFALGQTVVTEKDALIRIPGITRPSLGDHFSICKPRHAGDSPIPKILGHLRGLMSQIAPTNTQLSGGLSVLPRTNAEFLARGDLLKKLHIAWNSKTTTFILNGPKLIGKTALVAHFVDQLLEKEGRQLKRVEFSCPAQHSEASFLRAIEDFWLEAQRVFDSEKKSGSEWNSGSRASCLARYMAQSKSLVVLDGLEVLLDLMGQIADPEISQLVSLLMNTNPGLLIITSAAELGRINNGPCIQAEELGGLDKETSKKLVLSSGFQGSEEQLEQVLARDEGVPGFLIISAGSRGDDEFGLDNHNLELDLFRQRIGHRMDQFRSALENPEKAGVASMVLAICLAVSLLEDPPTEGDLTNILFSSDIRPFSLSYGTTIKSLKGNFSAALEYLVRSNLVERIDAEMPHRYFLHSYTKGGMERYFKHHYPTALTSMHDRLYDVTLQGAQPRPETWTQMRPLFGALKHGISGSRRKEAIETVYLGYLHQDGQFLRRYHQAIRPERELLHELAEGQTSLDGLGLDSLSVLKIFKHAHFTYRATGEIEEAVRTAWKSARYSFDHQREFDPDDLIDWCETFEYFGRFELAYITADRSIRGFEHRRKQGHAIPPSLSECRSYLFRAYTGLQQGRPTNDIASDVQRAEEIQIALEDADAKNKRRTPQWSQLYGVQGYLVGTILIGSGAFQRALAKALYMLDAAKAGMAKSELTQGLAGC